MGTYSGCRMCVDIIQTAADAMGVARSHVSVDWYRFCAHALLMPSGRLRTPTLVLGAARRLRAGARRRAVVKRGRLYFVPTHTSPTVPRGRSPAAHPAAAVAPRTFVIPEMSKGG